MAWIRYECAFDTATNVIKKPRIRQKVASTSPPTWKRWGIWMTTVKLKKRVARHELATRKLETDRQWGYHVVTIVVRVINEMTAVINEPRIKSIPITRKNTKLVSVDLSMVAPILLLLNDALWVYLQNWRLTYKGVLLLNQACVMKMTTQLTREEVMRLIEILRREGSAIQSKLQFEGWRLHDPVLLSQIISINQHEVSNDRLKDLTFLQEIHL